MAPQQLKPGDVPALDMLTFAISVYLVLCRFDCAFGVNPFYNFLGKTST